MKKSNNIYNYKTPKSMNEETHFLLTKGRITLGAFLLRCLFVISLIVITNLIYYYYAIDRYYFWLEKGNGVVRNNTFLTTFRIFENINFIFLPLLTIIFLTIQGVKRIHDVNKSGWFLLVPLYNIILLFKKGTIGNNDYGIDPKPQKKVEYFDEL